MSGKSPTYAPAQLASILTDFYSFLATLHFDVANLKFPPPDGWPDLTIESCAGWKSNSVIDLLRRLPYFHGQAAIHYKSKLIDYSRMNFDRIKEETAAKEEGLEFWANRGQRKSKYFVYLAWGRESGGRELLLNVKDAEVTEDVLETNTLPPRNIIEYLNDLKEAYRNLRLIPCQGRVTIEADDVAERSSHISKRQVLAQSESWGTDVDIQYVRQLYRQHGWPDAFRRKDAENAVEELMEAVLDQRDDEWEREMEDWLSDCGQEEWSSGDESDYRELELTIATKHE